MRNVPMPSARKRDRDPQEDLFVEFRVPEQIGGNTPRDTDSEGSTPVSSPKIPPQVFPKLPPQVPQNQVVPSVSPNQVPSKEEPKQDKEMYDFEVQCDLLLMDALAPIYSMINMISARLGDRDSRIYYRYEKGATLRELQSSVIIHGNREISEFRNNNRHLGAEVLDLLEAQFYVKTKSKENDLLIKKDVVLINASANVWLEDEFNTHRERTNIVLADYVWEKLDKRTLKYILNSSCQGSIDMALSVVKRIPGCENFTLHQLVGENVRDMFALFVAHQFILLHGGNAYAKGVSTSMGRVNDTNLMFSAGLRTRNQIYQQLECAKFWFQDVYAVENPLKRELRAELPKIDAELIRVLGSFQYPQNRDTVSNFINDRLNEKNVIVLLKKYNAQSKKDHEEDKIATKCLKLAAKILIAKLYIETGQATVLVHSD